MKLLVGRFTPQDMSYFSLFAISTIPFSVNCSRRRCLGNNNNQQIKKLRTSKYPPKVNICETWLFLSLLSQCRKLLTAAPPSAREIKTSLHRLFSGNIIKFSPRRVSVRMCGGEGSKVFCRKVAAAEKLQRYSQRNVAEVEWKIWK